MKNISLLLLLVGIISMIVLASCKTQQLPARATAGELLTQSLTDANAGKYDEFLKKVDRSLHLTWVIKVLPSPYETDVEQGFVRSATLREVARRLASPPETHRKQSQKVAWQFFVKCVRSSSDDPSIHHSTLFACWTVLRKHLKDNPSGNRIWQALERHFVEYRKEVKRLRERYGEEIPLREIDALGIRMLNEIRRIVALPDGSKEPVKELSLTESRFAHVWKKYETSQTTIPIPKTTLPTSRDARAIQSLYIRAVKAYLSDDFKRLAFMLSPVSADGTALRQSNKRRETIIKLSKHYREKKLGDINLNSPIQILGYHRVLYPYMVVKLVPIIASEDVLKRASEGDWEPVDRLVQNVVVFETQVGQYYFLEIAHRDEDGQWRLMTIPLHIFEGMLDDDNRK